MSYELWATDGGNFVGSYETEAEALEVVAELARRYRSRQGRRLEWLALFTADAPPGSDLVAEGPALVSRALGRDADLSSRHPTPRRKRAAA